MPTPRLTVLICTHNRAELLARVLASLNAAQRPSGWEVDILVAANACIDDTAERLECYRHDAEKHGWLTLDWFAEPTPGKSNALNSAIPRLTGDIAALVDDDHRVATDYLVNICAAADTYPEATMFCGRIVPDWDGAEPAWVHDEGAYRIYPLPVPRYDQGSEPKRIGFEGPLPGGGNLFLRRAAFERIGGFSTELGPVGHDLGGGEDSEFVLRALRGDERLQYVPNVTQYHFVDLSRFKLRYLLQKSYQRSLSVARVHHASGKVPLYMWRKLTEYSAAAVLSLSWRRTRFYMVRVAATLGEIRGFASPPQPDIGLAGLAHEAPGIAPIAGWYGMAVIGAAITLPWQTVLIGGLTATAVAGLFALLLLVKSMSDFSRTGPQLRDEILQHYWRYSLYALGRLGMWAFVLALLFGSAGMAVYAQFASLAGTPLALFPAAVAAMCGLAAISALQFVRHLLFLPATIAASSHYRLSRFYKLWRALSPQRFYVLQTMVGGLGGVSALGYGAQLIMAARWSALGLYGVLGAVAWLLLRSVCRSEEPLSVRGESPRHALPNIVMIGSDTLRADRLGAAGYRRDLTPHLDRLARRGSQFLNCYAPCARTAPSLVSLLTGTWPHTHGLRDNFVGDEQKVLPVEGLPTILTKMGYRTAAIGDWAAADLGKFDLGFQQLDLPEDQWNLKFLIRQGPKDLRLFLSLFTHNRFGKVFLPELYYLAGVPLTREVGRDARATISDLAQSGGPFMLNIFMAATHPPFGSEYPYYTTFADPDYAGESKFVMARLTDPFEIIRRQGEPRTEFDLDQVINLYDGCVTSFDDEVARILAHIESCGLRDNTIVVIYSDHGMEFFEHDTWGQGNSIVGDFSPKVPLIIADPRRPGGRIITDAVRTVDVAPTLLDLLGLHVPSAMEGISLRGYTESGTETPPPLAAFAETGIWLTDLPGMSADHLRYPSLLELLEVPDKKTGTLALKSQYWKTIIAAKDRMVRQGKWKLIYQPTVNGYRLKLFDVEADPECRIDLLPSHPAVANTLWSTLKAWVEADPACVHPALGSTGNKDCPASR